MRPHIVLIIASAADRSDCFRFAYRLDNGLNECFKRWFKTIV